MERPNPAAAPVTMATLPFSDTIVAFHCVSGGVVTRRRVCRQPSTKVTLSRLFRVFYGFGRDSAQRNSFLFSPRQGHRQGLLERFRGHRRGLRSGQPGQPTRRRPPIMSTACKRSNNPLNRWPCLSPPRNGAATICWGGAALPHPGPAVASKSFDSGIAEHCAGEGLKLCQCAVRPPSTG